MCGSKTRGTPIVWALLLNGVIVMAYHQNYLQSNISRSFIERTPKFISFSTEDEDIHVDLEFIVPFLKIPVKRTFDKGGAALKSFVNVNTASIILSALFVATGAGISAVLNGNSYPSALSSVLNGFRKKRERAGSSFDPLKLISRQPGGKVLESGMEDFWEQFEDSFREGGIDVGSCIQKTVCAYVGNAIDNNRRGEGTSWNKIIDGVVSSKWVMNYLQGTAVKDAVDVGGTGKAECYQKYGNCNLTEEDILNKFLNYFN